jgi:hypothetical protein
MPLQNRVLPSGEIVADPARGMFTGNRGILHDDQRRLGQARWKGKAWICCALQFKGWQRQVMTPGKWTELFFLDEAVALAAGHRPCAVCRREAYLAYQAAFGGLKAVEMDTILHTARIGMDRGQRRFIGDIGMLPDGVMILHEDKPHLVHGGQARACHPAGYGVPIALPEGLVTVMTPVPVVAVLRAGYRPVLHPTASGAVA